MSLTSSPENEEHSTKQQIETPNKSTNILTELFKPVPGYFITPILIIVTSVIFIVMVSSGINFISPDVESMIKWGANFRPVTLENGYWRLFTSCFLHYGIIHLLLNMYALFYIGKILEPYLGKVRFITAYLLTGIAGSTASLYWNDYTVSAGASGAVFGMYGVFLALMTTKIVHSEIKKSLTSSMLLFVGYNLFFGIASDAGIDNAAHIGGIVSGFILGYAFIPGMKQVENTGLNRLTIVASIVVVFISAAVVYKKLPNDVASYQTSMKQFAELEQQALAVYELPQNTTFGTHLSAINSGISAWGKSLQLINEAEQMDLPESYQEQNKLLKEYCELRLQAFTWMKRAVEENTTAYTSEIEQLNLKVDSLLTIFNQE